MTPTRRLVLNWALIEQRRIAAGLSHAQLADRVGAGVVTGPSRLWADHNHDHVRLEVLEKLCRVLDLHPAELFTPPTRAKHRASAPRPPSPVDGRILEAALATLAVWRGGHHRPSPGGRAALADALGWPLARLDAAVAALEEDLADRGQHLDQHRDRVELRPRDGLLSVEQRVALHRIHGAGAGVDGDVELARGIYAIAHPDSRGSENHAAFGAALVTLQQHGLAHRRHHRASHVELTDDARFALFLDPDPY